MSMDANGDVLNAEKVRNVSHVCLKLYKINPTHNAIALSYNTR